MSEPSLVSQSETAKAPQAVSPLGPDGGADLHGLIGALKGNDGDRERLDKILTFGPSDWEDVLVDAPLVRWSTAAFSVNRDDLGRNLENSYARFSTDSHYQDVFGYIGLFLLSIVLLSEVERRQSGSAKDTKDTGHGHWESLADRLIKNEAVRNAINEIYKPTSNSKEAVAWEAIDFKTLSFYKLGTTSFILKGERSAAGEGTPESLALKCLLYPYTRTPQIADATKKYQANYGVKGADHLISVWASTGKWILMDYVPGKTLQEWLDNEFGSSRPSGIGTRRVRLDALQEMSAPLFDALDELQEKGKVHEDLSPTNIIVETRKIGDKTGYHVTLIDLGRNYLYTRSVGAIEGPDAIYIAQEVKEETPGGHRSADVYSLGQILIALGGVGRNPDGTVPDAFYERVPLVARFIEDLIDQNPETRLVLFGSGEGWKFGELGKVFNQELDATTAAEQEKAAPTDERLFTATVDLFRPDSRSPWRLWRLWKRRMEQESQTGGKRRLFSRWLAWFQPSGARSLFSRWLLAWSFVCAMSWYVVSITLIAWTLRDLSLGSTPVRFELLQRLLNSPHEFPVVDDLQVAGYRFGLPYNLAARMVGISFALIGTKYYQNIFAGLTPLLGHRRLTDLGDRLRTYGTEFFVRMFAWWWAPLVLLPNLHDPRWWSICTAVGISGTCATNWACRSFSKRAIRKAQAIKLSTVPKEDNKVTGLAMFYDWAPSSLFYALLAWPIGLLIFFGVLKDELVYASGVALLNVGLFYIFKCSINAAQVRGGLARAFLAAERLRYVESPKSFRLAGHNRHWHPPGGEETLI